MNALSAQLWHSSSYAVAHRPILPETPHIQPQSVQATVAYTEPRPDGEPLVQYIRPLPDGSRPSNLIVDKRQVQINDIHTAQRQFSLQRSGFQLERLTVEEDIDWTDQEQVQAHYYPKVEELIRKVAGATRVHIFDHTIRKGSLRDADNSSGTGRSSSDRTPVSRVHVDYNMVSGVQRMHAVMPEEEAAALSKTPFAVVQVWRPLRGPVQESPLAMIDAQTVSKDDYMDLRLEFEGPRTGYNYALKYNPAHQWYYTKGMEADEAYIFKCYDSRNDRARFTPHTGFSDPTTPANAPPRESIEIRAYAFWENEEPQPPAMVL